MSICWIYEGSLNYAGYGVTEIEGKQKRVHRLVYEVLVGPIPDGLEPDHLCRNKACYNPAHLEPVTHAENMRRADNAQRHRTHCPQGHGYSHQSHGKRHCRICRNEAGRRSRERKRMKQVEEFTSPPPAGFEKYADGQIYRAIEGEDYQNRRSFLGSLTRWAGLNGYVVERIVNEGSVEFRLIGGVVSAEKDEESF